MEHLNGSGVTDVVVVLGLRALRDSIKCCIGCLPEREGERKENFRIEVNAPGKLLV